MLPAGRDLSIPPSELRFRVRSHRRERLDVYLLRRLGWSSRTKIRRLIEAGRVFFKGSVTKPSQRLQRGAEIRVLLAHAGELAEPDRTPAPFWEDPYLLAVNKPPGVLVHPVGRTVAGTIIDGLHRYYRDANETGGRRTVPRLCHRLDRETSGVLLVAKNSAARRALQRAFEENRVSKDYFAVVEGAPRESRLTIDLPICGERSVEEGRRLARVSPRGKPAQTRVTIVATTGEVSLVSCRPITGRQNQIRAHLAAIGHPILGDVGYGSSESAWSAGRAALDHGIRYPSRALLHSRSLRFPHPIWGVPHEIDCPVPTDMRPFLAMLSVP